MINILEQEVPNESLNMLRSELWAYIIIVRHIVHEYLGINWLLLIIQSPKQKVATLIYIFEDVIVEAPENLKDTKHFRYPENGTHSKVKGDSPKLSNTEAKLSFPLYGCVTFVWK